MAYAAIAGLPLVVGLYTALVPLVVYAVMGTSRPLSVTTTSTIAILTAGALHQIPLGADNQSLVSAAATLAFLVGGILVVASVLRLGVVASFISEPVLVGFKAGVGLTIVVDQVPKLLGVHFAPGHFFHNVISIAGHLPQASVPTVLLALSLLALIYHANRRPVFVLGRKPGTDVFRPQSQEHPEDETFPGLLMLKTEGVIHFANAQRIGDLMWPLINEHKPRVVVMDCSAIPDLEYTALKMLADADRRLQQAGISLWLAALNPEPLRLIQKSELGKTLGRPRMYFNLEQAVTSYLTHFGDPNAGRAA